jgi:hypothetical protein
LTILLLTWTPSCLLFGQELIRFFIARLLFIEVDFSTSAYLKKILKLDFLKELFDQYTLFQSYTSFPAFSQGVLPL